MIMMDLTLIERFHKQMEAFYFWSLFILIPNETLTWGLVIGLFHIKN
jgi:hypothetical protein